MLLRLPDPVDRDILTRLVGVQRETWYYGSYESIYRFEPAGFELETLLPVISDTGRLYARIPTGDVRPVRWDSGGSWNSGLMCARTRNPPVRNLRGISPQWRAPGHFAAGADLPRGVLVWANGLRLTGLL